MSSQPNGRVEYSYDFGEGGGVKKGWSNITSECDIQVWRKSLPLQLIQNLVETLLLRVYLASLLVLTKNVTSNYLGR